MYVPRGFHKEFKHIKFDYSSFYEWQFFTFFQKTCDNDLLQCFNEKSVNFRTERIAAGLRKAEKIFMPKFIRTPQFLEYR